MATSNISDTIQQAIVAGSNGFNNVIADVADGFKRCGFFNDPGWQTTLLHGFERKRLGHASGEIRYNTTVYTSVLSDDSFKNGMAAQSTPLAAGRIGQNRGAQMARNERPSKLLDNGTAQRDAQMIKKPRSSVNEIEAAKILVDLQKTNWGQILPAVNNSQEAAQFDDVFEKSRRVRGLITPLRDKLAGNAPALRTANLPDQNQVTTTNSITKRRKPVSLYTPAAKRRSVSVPDAGSVAVAQLPVPNGSKNGKPSNALQPTVPANNGVPTNITNRRVTRKQSQLLATYSGSNSALGVTSSNITERRATGYFQRTSVLFTMIDASQYKLTLQKYNIFVADDNEQYDYVITDRIYRSAKFLSAVVSGKPILSIDWLHALEERKVWLEPLNYVLKDDEGEKEYGFQLSDAIMKANNKRLFENYSILVTAHTAISPDLLKGVIFSGGGKFLKTTLKPRRDNQVICISDEADRKTWPTLSRKYPDLKKIISLDGFSKMIFQHTYDVSAADVLRQI